MYNSWSMGLSKKVLFINNLSASKKYLPKKIFDSIPTNSKNDYKMVTVKKPGDSTKFIKKALKNGVEVVGVFGGDGTVSEAAKSLFRQKPSLFIVPGGTANIIAKELGIPTDPEKSIREFEEGNMTNKSIDMGLANDVPFLIRINWGVLTNMVTKTSSKMKKSIGQTAYTITALKELLQQNEVTYSLTIDGKKRVVRGVALMVTNSGNIGFKAFSLTPTISVDDGKLNIIVIKKANLSLLTSLSKIIFNKRASHFSHWKAKKILVRSSPSQDILFDDVPVKKGQVSIQVAPKALNVLVPKYD